MIPSQAPARKARKKTSMIPSPAPAPAPESESETMQEDTEGARRQPTETEDAERALSEMQAKVDEEIGGTVDYACTPEEVQHHFQSCGTINRVTIPVDELGQPKGYAYVEFLEVEAVQNAILLNKSVLLDRQLRVCAKRTNIPGMKQHQERQPGPHMADWSRRPYVAQPYFGYGKAPRFPRPARYSPYN